MSRTVAQKKNADGFPKAGELIEFRAQQELSLQDRRILNLLIEHAGPSIVKENGFRIAMAALRGNHKGGERVRDSIVRLMTTIVEVPVRDRNGKRATRRGQFLADTTATDDENDPNGEVHYSFSHTMREVIAQSQYWGRLKAYVICSFQSKLHWHSMKPFVCGRTWRSVSSSSVARPSGRCWGLRRENSNAIRTLPGG